MSAYQELKPIITDLLLLSRDAIHIHIGFVCLALVLLFTSKKMSSFSVLLPGLIISIIMELLDMRDDYYSKGFVNIAASIHDLINTNFIPFCLVIMARYKKIRV
jgi:hypothetical protein